MNDTFGVALRQMRERARKSMGDLARCLEVSVVFISDVEKGRRSPLTPSRILDAAQFLGGDPTDLLLAAAKTKGAFQLSADEGSARKMAVGAALMRGWADLDDPELEEIDQILERKAKGR